MTESTDSTTNDIVERAEPFLKGLSHLERMRIGGSVVQLIGAFKGWERIQKSMGGDQVAQVVLVAVAGVHALLHHDVRKLQHGPSSLLAAYAYHCAHVASVDDVAPTTRTYGLALARRALALASALDGLDRAKIANETIGAARQVRLENLNKLRVFAGKTYRAKKYHSRNQAAKKMLSEVLAYADQIGAKVAKHGFAQTLYHWLLKDFPQK